VFDQLYDLDLAVLYPALIILIAGAAELGAWLDRRLRGGVARETDISTLTGAALGLLALLMAFSFSLALSRYDARRTLVLEEANAIGSTANFALMLPESVQQPILGMLRDYTAVRIGLGVPYDPAKLERDVARSLELQTRLWQQAVAVTAAAPQSLPAYRFVGSLNEMKQHSRATIDGPALPRAGRGDGDGIAMVAMGFTGYQSGAMGFGRRAAALIMSVRVALVIMLVVDLDRPARRLILVPVQPLVDAAQGIPP
jgi:hypothetical protein